MKLIGYFKKNSFFNQRKLKVTFNKYSQTSYRTQLSDICLICWMKTLECSDNIKEYIHTSKRRFDIISIITANIDNSVDVIDSFIIKHNDV